VEADKSKERIMSIHINEFELKGRLKPITRTWTSGKIHAIIGPNGSGKTTILEALAGFFSQHEHSPKTPALTYDGKAQTIAQPLQLAKLRSFVESTHDAPFPFSVFDVISWGRWHLNQGVSSKTDQEFVKLCANKFGIETLLSRPVTEISTGERKRVHLARSLASDVMYHLWDEPFAPLDVASTLKIVDLMRHETRQGKTFILSLHELPLALHLADELTILHDGGILFQGSPHLKEAFVAIESSFDIKLQPRTHYYAAHKN
jgi:iron complex transport system ATP-binding protein